MQKRIPEIMSPAGDFINLSAALNAGADAIYFGVKGFNMRAGAKNFELKDLPKVVKMCHKAGARAYLTLNTIYYQSELKKLDGILKKAKSAKLDAVIAWDFAVLAKAREFGVEVYLSTQASISNADALCEYYEKFGIRRFVLARECSIDDIATLRRQALKRLGKDADIKIEVFAHGAMCVSQSGRCFMSTFACGKSANRGECLQPCRREYEIRDANGNGFVVGNGYVMSPQDLCTVPFIEKLFEAGVDSLKIEGRNRNAEYVAIATRTYRALRDFYFANRKAKDFKERFEVLKKDAMQELAKVFNRGFSDGFFMGKPVGDWTSAGNQATAKKTIVGHIVKFFPKISVAEISVDVASMSIGERIQIEGDSTGFVEFNLESMQADGKPIEKATKGMSVGVKVPQKLRVGDRVYKLA